MNKKEATGEILARPHFAKALIKKGYCKNIDEAFDKFLAKNTLAYVPRLNCPPELAITYIRENGAFSSLAHPKLISQDENFILDLIKKLKSYGLNAIEANYPSFSQAEQKKYKSWAKKFDLFVSGGSDFHGSNRENIFLGQAGISYENLERIKNYINENR